VTSDERNRIPPDLQDITSAILITSADAERGFRTMNIMQLPSEIPWPNLIFVSFAGPPLNYFNPMPQAR